MEVALTKICNQILAWLLSWRADPVGIVDDVKSPHGAPVFLISTPRGADEVRELILHSRKVWERNDELAAFVENSLACKEAEARLALWCHARSVGS